MTQKTSPLREHRTYFAGADCTATLLRAALRLAVAISFGILPSLWAQQEVIDLEAHTRILPDAGPGVRALKRDSHNQIYVLTSGAAVQVYGPDGKLAAQMPKSTSKQDSILSGSDMDVDSSGRVYVADRGANAVRVFASDGTLAVNLPIPSPTSVVALPDGEMAVTSATAKHLLAIFNAQGKQVREFGDLAEAAERPELNRYLNIGRLAADQAGNIYYAFCFLPDPTIHKYDRSGRDLFDIELTTPEFLPQAMAMRRAIDRQEHGGPPSLQPIINAIAVDPQNGQIWMSMGNQLLLLNPDGAYRAGYMTFAPDGARIQPVAILPEPDRLLLAGELGVFEFSRPNKVSSTPPAQP